MKSTLPGAYLANGQVSLAIGTPGSTAISLASRESGANAPQLVVTTEVNEQHANHRPDQSYRRQPIRRLRDANDSSHAYQYPDTHANLTETVGATTTPTRTATLTSTPTRTGVPSSTPTTDPQPHFPIRAAFYYPWFPEGWTQQGIYPYTNYTPGLGTYNSGSATIIRKHIEAMQYGKIQVGISSWWGPGHYTDDHVSALLTAASGTPFRWALYYENESYG